MMIVSHIYHSDKQRHPELEHLIIKDPEATFQYTKYIIKGKWKEGEITLLHNPYWALQYSLHVLHRRWKKAEPHLKQDHHIWHQYLHDLNIEE